MTAASAPNAIACCAASLALLPSATAVTVAPPSWSERRRAAPIISMLRPESCEPKYSVRTRMPDSLGTLYSYCTPELSLRGHRDSEAEATFDGPASRTRIEVGVEADTVR